MSMYRQIWLSLILTAVLSLAGGLLASTLTARSYLEDQLRTKNEDNAASLALSLNQRNVDSMEIQLAVSALFDNGHYELIRVLDPNGKEIVSKKASAASYDAPLWFVRSLPLISQPGHAQINNGWNQVGTITLISSTRFAYKALWDSTLALIFALVLTSLFGGWLGTLVLRRIKKPLNAVIAQAQAITERHFITTPESNVPELRQLTSAMNSTVLLVKKMFADEAIRLEQVRLEANSDPLTKLANRNYFMAQLQAVLEMEDSFSGTLLLIRIANLAELNKRLGRTETDNMLVSVADTLNRLAHEIPNSLAARLNGADFGLLLPLIDAHPIADQLLDTLVISTSAYFDSGPVAFIGTGKFSYGQNLGNLLSQVDAALVGAEAQHINCVHDAESLISEDSPRSNEQWLKLIYNAIENREAKLGSFPVTDFDQRLIHNECPLRLKFLEEWLPAGRFLPIAERLGMSSTLDTAALTLGIEELNMNRQIIGLAINVSARSLEDVTFCDYIRTLLLANPKASRRLWIEFPEFGAYAHIAAFKEFRHQMEGTGVRLGLEHFGRQFSQIGQLQELKLDYLKVDASFIRDIASNDGNQVFLRGLIGIAHNIGMQIFAEGVTEQSEMAVLKTLGFDGATGPGVRIAPVQN
ncbi:EAL domain-containing protein (putative c-di-GMP-specific phosphodiesterase class I)/GGDEF domain-containing protein [Oxalobacteraceae bacterium GrIS 2.11]